MKNIDSLKRKQMLPKKETVKFLLRFSKSVETVALQDRKILISKN